MKSFSQFLQEAYLSEEDAEQLRLFKRDNKSTYNFRKNIGNRGISADPTPLPVSRRLPASSPQPSGESPGQQVIRQGSNLPTTKALPPGQKGAPLSRRTGSNPNIPDAMIRGAQDAANRPTPTPKPPSVSSITKTQKPVNVKNITDPRRAAAGTGPSGKPIVTPPPSASSSTSYRNVGLGKETIKTPSSTTQPQAQRPSNPNIANRKPGESTQDLAARRQAASQARMNRSSSAIVPAGRSSSALTRSSVLKGADTAATVASSAPKVGKFAKLAKFAGPASTALDVVTSAADERAKGSGWFRSLAKGATVAAGGLLGGTAGSVAGPVGSIGGAIAGGAAAEKAFDTVAGANARERAAMAKANRQRQAGSSIKGIGGPTTFSKGKGGTGFMSTGVGSQRKTVQLAKTGEVQRGGQSVAGHLAFKGGKAVYKAGPSAQSLAQTSSNPLERIGRSLFAGAYKKHDAAKAAQALQKARQSDIARNKALGVKFKPGG